MSIPTSDLTGSFWLAGGTMLFAFFGLIIRYSYKSKCKNFSICCLKIERDIESEKEEDIEALHITRNKSESPKITSTTI
jgi:hypothetical protein